VNSKEGDVEQWSLDGSKGYLKSKLIKSFKFGSQLEGMVADDENGILFVGEEDRGIWSVKLNKRGKIVPVLLQEGSISNNQALKADIEGLALSYSVTGGYLVASSQGNNSYAIFNRKPPHAYVGSFNVIKGKVDGTEETDGLEILNLPLNKKFPSGIFIVQDGINTGDNNDTIPQNFKFISWSSIIRSAFTADNNNFDSQITSPEKN
jgi:3-phytase